MGRGAALTPREREVLQLAANDRSAQATAEELGIAVWTVRSHRDNVLRSLGCHTTTGAVAIAMRNGWVK